MLSSLRVLSILAINFLLTQQDFAFTSTTRADTSTRPHPTTTDFAPTSTTRAGTSTRHHPTSTTPEWPSKRCQSCVRVLTEVVTALQNATTLIEEHVLKLVEAECGKKHYLAEKACEYFDELVVHELFNAIKELEDHIDVERVCQRIHLCPHVKH
ncbi:hypothetical protein KIN20_014322 [Parelaphostrongylus tenuis]|uniref:Saposin B-type domain-containing protein n=1 Tax=Parelaphostrongylus tenuis TaxID=148309 RepID=A0AAD5QPB6_PARTN|nr:hypothetical protein KIN20_014322 [Parelaphostrongylus tenuis]